MMKPIDGVLTSGFHEPRPLHNPGQHIHGAIDLAAEVGTPIYAPETGALMAWASYRSEVGETWPRLPEEFPWANYFYDVYGGLLVLFVPNEGRTLHTHIIAHCYSNQLFNKSVWQQRYYVEQREERRFPLHALYTATKFVKKGEAIGAVGNAGYSTGSHIHWEIHPGARWSKHEDRINPEEYL